MLALYGVHRSRASRPIWLLHEIGLPFTHVPVIQAYRLPDARAPAAPLNTASPEFLKINPLGQIPVMVDGDLVLTESMAILMYVAQSRGGGALGPGPIAEVGEMLQWAFFAATAVEGPALEILYAQQDGQADTPEGRGIIAVAAEKLRRPLARVEAHLAAAPGGHLMGGRFTAADIALAECLRYAQGHAGLLSEFPAVKRWLEGCQSRPAFRRMWEARMAEPA
jgi:glutathione S-transferase